MSSNQYFENTAMKAPTGDSQIVRVDMEEQQIGGRKSHLPGQMKSDVLSIGHVPNMGSKT
jgi:hypothetical protein